MTVPAFLSIHVWPCIAWVTSDSFILLPMSCKSTGTTLSVHQRCAAYTRSSVAAGLNSTVMCTCWYSQGAHAVCAHALHAGWLQHWLLGEYAVGSCIAAGH